MKYIFLLGDGMSDYPNADGRTPLMDAHKPTMDALSGRGILGLCRTVPAGMTSGSDTANLSALGYDPVKYYTGRSPLEAASMRIPLADTDITYRCNLVTVSNEPDYQQKTMIDYSAGEISTAEAAVLIRHLAEHMRMPGYKLYNGVSYRHCLVRSVECEGQLLGIRYQVLGNSCHDPDQIQASGRLPIGGGAAKRSVASTGGTMTQEWCSLELVPPHDITGRPVAGHLPEEDSDIYKFMASSYGLLAGHEVNRKRIAAGKNPANSAWIWGEGKKAALTAFREKTGYSGAIISAVDLLKGIGVSAGMDVIDVEGATGNLDTNFEGKADAAFDALAANDFVFIHVEAADECGHHGDYAGKVKAIEYLSERLLKRLLARLDAAKTEYCVLMMPDHVTPVATRKHAGDPVPFAFYDSAKSYAGAPYNEQNAAKGMFVDKGHEMIGMFFKRFL